MSVKKVWKSLGERFLDFLFFLKLSLKVHGERVKRELMVLKHQVLSKEVIESSEVDFLVYGSKIPSGLDEKLLLTLPSDDYYIFRELDELFEEWLKEWEGGSSGSVAIVGERGSGKTSFLRYHSKKVGGVYIRFPQVRSDSDLLRVLSNGLGFKSCESVNGLINLLNSDEFKGRVVFLDDCHNLFLRRVGGLDHVKTLLLLLESTQGTVFWVTAWDRFGYYYLNNVLNFSKLFSKVKSVPGFSANELRTVLTNVFERSGVVIKVKPSDEYLRTHRVVNMRKVEEKFWEDLAQFSNGNPVIGLTLLKFSVEVDSGEFVVKRVKSIESTGLLSGVSDLHLFALAALLLHDGLTLTDLSSVLDLDKINARIVLNDLFFKKVVVKDGSFYVIPPVVVPLVKDLLVKKNVVSGDL